MEGTKHEKAVILFLAYIVGFTSGFIAFNTDKPVLETTSAIENIEAVSIEEAPTETPVVTDNEETEVATDTTNEYSNPLHPEGTHAYYQNGRLFVSVDGQVTLLSMEKNRMAANVTSLFSNQGSHVAIPHSSVSPNNQFVYFCEQQADADRCVSFVYSLESQTIYAVMDKGEKVILTAAEAKNVTWNDNTLSVGTSYSTSPETPWKLASR